MHKNFKQPAGGTSVALRWVLKIIGRGGVLGAILFLGLLLNPAPAFGVGLPGGSVNLAWDASPSSEVTGYRIYFGSASGNYTNSVAVGNLTAITFGGLGNGVPYFFSVVAYTASGLESILSNEIAYVPGGGSAVQINVAANRQVNLLVAGQNGRAYNIEASQTPNGGWTTIGTVTVGASGSVSFTDANAPSFTKRFYRARQL